jgi:EAL domain-containing protein (putative c-di-GMP-specific phosphodiesterase class I)
MALRHTLPDSTYLSVNMSPDAILAPEMEDALGDGDLAGLVIEITEHEAVGDYARLSSRLADYRGRGALVAIDDAGAGHASMRHVTQLNPDYIKIDRSLIHDIHLDHAKRALVRSMVTLEKELGAAIVAEGIESAEELGTLRSLGVPFGQGYLLARPASSATPAPWSGALLALAEPAVEA